MSYRKQGMSYREIASRCGVTFQAVAQALSHGEPRMFKRINAEGKRYPALVRWMNENRVSRSELCRRMGIDTYASNIARVTSWLNGHTELRKADIDRLLDATGMTYEELFKEAI